MVSTLRFSHCPPRRSACLHPVHNAPFDFGMVLVVAAALVSVGGYYLFGGSREKPKIN